MKKSSLLKLRLFSALAATALLIANSPVLLAAEEEEEAAAEPVWVLSYASFLIFAAVTIFLSVFFSRRAESAYTNEERKKYGQIRADRTKQRAKEERLARIQASKKKK